MKAAAREWVNKAEADFAAALLLPKIHDLEKLLLLTIHNRAGVGVNASGDGRTN